MKLSAETPHTGPHHDDNRGNSKFPRIHNILNMSTDAAGAEPDRNASKTANKKIVCGHFVRGKCSHSVCRFSHDLSDGDYVSGNPLEVHS